MFDDLWFMITVMGNGYRILATMKWWPGEVFAAASREGNVGNVDGKFFSSASVSFYLVFLQ